MFSYSYLLSEIKLSVSESQSCELKVRPRSQSIILWLFYRQACPLGRMTVFRLLGGPKISFCHTWATHCIDKRKIWHAGQLARARSHVHRCINVRIQPPKPSKFGIFPTNLPLRSDSCEHLKNKILSNCTHLKPIFLRLCIITTSWRYINYIITLITQ